MNKKAKSVVKKAPYPKLYANNKEMKALLEKQYPHIEVVLTKRMPEDNPNER